MSVKELRERRAKVFEQMKGLNDRINGENRAFTSDEDRRWTEMNSDYNKLTMEIEAAEQENRAVNFHRGYENRAGGSGAAEVILQRQRTPRAYGSTRPAGRKSPSSVAGFGP